MVLLVVALVGCASGPPPEPEQEPQPEPVQQTPPEPAPEPAPDPPKEEPAPEEFEVTQEVYDRTFDQVNETISELNTTIQRKDYETWLSYLTDNYIENTSRPEYLERWKEDPFLQKKNVTLRDLQDFFNYLVVPTRSNVRLDEIEFVDQSHVYAYTVYKGEKYLLYSLVRTDEGWKVDFY
jgi:hypothetical protein